MGKTAIYVAAHKKVELSLPDGYRLCQVNASKNGRWEGDCVHDDDSADNISGKNDRYCELTALYALWKNSDADVKGLAHYRRFFSANNKLSPQNAMFRTILPGDMPRSILGQEQIADYLRDHDILIEYPRFPIFCSAYEDLLRFVFPEDIRVLSSLIHTEYPEYEDSWQRVLRSTNISYLNMLVAGKKVFDEYCSWLFELLGKLEDRLPRVEGYDSQHKRIFGYLGEVLLNVWVLKNALRIRYVFSLQLLENYKYGENRLVTTAIRTLKKQILVPADMRKPYYRFRFGNIRQSAEKPYTVTLDDVYRQLFSPEDAAEYFRQIPLSHTSLETGADGHVQYVCALVEEATQFQYPQSNRRCIATLFVDDPAAAQAAVKEIREKYEDRYTVTFRVITCLSEMKVFLEEEPEIYVFQQPETTAGKRSCE